MQKQQQQQSGLPEVIRVKAQRGFRGLVNGRFGVANPGDVVDVPRDLAMELRGAQKAYMVDEELKTQANFVPERKRISKAAPSVAVKA